MNKDKETEGQREREMRGWSTGQGQRGRGASSQGRDQGRGQVWQPSQESQGQAWQSPQGTQLQTDCFFRRNVGHFKWECLNIKKEKAVLPLMAFDDEYSSQGFLNLRTHQKALINLKVGPQGEEVVFLVDKGAA